MSGVVDNCCQEKTNRDGQLIRTDKETANPFGGSFRLVKRNWLNPSSANKFLKSKINTYSTLKLDLLQIQQRIDQQGRAE
jgi:hypothetical protein